MSSTQLKTNILILIILGTVFTILAIIFGTSMFSPDSWSYYELSKTIFTNNFYEFNTYRSYFSDLKSAAFPFGYPIVLATINLISENPINAVFINILFTILAMNAIQKISLKLEISYKVSCLISLSLLLYVPFLSEVFAGRSMPLAIMLYLYGILLLLNKKVFIAGIFLGLAVLVRFDYLVFGLLTILYYTLFFKKSSYILIGAFFIAILPWSIYSYIYFDSFWISDNSWVAKSAVHAFVLDYPAMSSETIFSDPLQWILKVVKNYIFIAKNLILNCRYYIFAFFVFVLFTMNIKRISNIKNYIFIIFLLASLAPYASTGYFDGRYFSLFYLVFTMFVLYEIKDIYKLNLKIIYFVFIISFILATKWFYIQVTNSLKNEEANKIELQKISNLHKQQQLDNKTYIFEKTKSNINPFKYGALTGGKTACFPSNFDKLDNNMKNEYFNHMKPYKIIEDINND